MKKYLLIILVLLLPIFVYADTCDNSKIVISDINVVDSKGYIEEIKSPNITNQSLTTNLKLYDVGDSITYSFKIKNNSNEDYDLSKNISDDKNISYEIISDNDKIKSGEEKVIQLKITYRNKVDNSKYKSGKYIQNKELNLFLGDNILNPNTGVSIIVVFLFISLLLIIGSFTFIKTNKKYLSLLVLLLMPFLVKAACQYKIIINSNIEFRKVLPNPCTYEGELVTGAQYVNGQYTYIYYNDVVTELLEEYNIDSLVIDGWGVVLTDKNSTDPVSSKLCTSINNKPIIAMDEMFAGSRAPSIDLSSFDTSNVISMVSIFKKTVATSLDLSNFDTSNVYFMQEMFQESQASKLDLSNFNTEKVVNMNAMFAGSMATTIDVSSFNTSNVVAMGAMFGYSAVTILDLSNFDTSKVKEMSYMFDGSKISTLNLTNFNTSNVTGMSYMFGDSQVTTIDVSSFDTRNVIDMSGMFANSKVTSLNLSNFDTSNVVNMAEMFLKNELDELDLSNFNTSQVIDMNKMFYEIKVNELDLSSFDMSHVEYVTEMFKYSDIKTIDVRSIDFTSMNVYEFDAYGVENGKDGFISYNLRTIYTKDDSNASFVKSKYRCGYPDIYVDDTLKFPRFLGPCSV